MSLFEIIDELSWKFIVEISVDYYHDMIRKVYRIDLVNAANEEVLHTYYGEINETLEDLFKRVYGLQLK